MNRSKRSMIVLISETLNIEKRKLSHIWEGITTKKVQKFQSNTIKDFDTINYKKKEVTCK